jgi:DNA-binding beta-propeller fold protein YncE
MRRSLAALLLAAATLLVFAASPASAALTRPYEGAIAQGAFTSAERSPGAMAVDQSSGDIYALDATSNNTFQLLRFDSSGAPKDFTAGPGAGTNAITGFTGKVADSFDTTLGIATAQVAVDNSDGPLAGTIYVTTGTSYFPFTSDGRVKAYAPTGAERGELDGTGTSTGDFRQPCGVAVDPSDGSIYVANYFGGLEGDNGADPALWRYAPDSPSGAIDDSDFTTTGIRASDCNLAALDGTLYSVSRIGGSLLRRSASQFTATPPPSDIAPSTSLGNGFRALAVDPATGEVYAESGQSAGGFKVSVFDPADNLSYRFGAAAYYGTGSAGIAVRSAPSGPAPKVYVSDPTADELDTFGLPVNAAVVQHPELHSFGPDGTDATSFSLGSPDALAFDPATDRLFAADPTVPGIFGFDASSPTPYPPLAGFSPLATAAQGFTPGLAADPATGNVYLASSETDLIYGFGPLGAPLGGAFPIDPATTPGAPSGSPKDLCGAAVSSTGELFVSNAATKRILRYSSAGAFQSSIDVSAQAGTEGPCQLAFAPNDDLYVALGDRGVWRYTASDSYASASLIDQNRPRGLAVDPTNNHLYVAHGNRVDEWDDSGALVSEFFSDGGSFRGIAVDPASGHVFVADGENGRRKVRVFAGDTIFPEATAQPAEAIANTSATLHGAVSGQGLALTDCRFQYVTDTAFQNTGFTDLSSGGEAGCDPAAGSIPVDFDPHQVSAEVTSLERDTTYRFRVIATGATGETASDSLTFTTIGPPGAETTGTPIRTDTTATLLGRVYPVRTATTYHFEWGTDTSYPNTTPARSAGSGDEIKLVAEPISGLEPDTTYHYRLLADNANPDGPTLGEDMTLTTKPGPDPVLDHGAYPGPPGSDRAWELVSPSDTSGNPAISGIGGVPTLSPDGNRAAFQVNGGTPISEKGTAFSPYLSTRPAGAHPDSGWQGLNLSPPRDQLLGTALGALLVAGAEDLGTVYFIDVNIDDGRKILWRFTADGGREPLLDLAPPRTLGNATIPNSTLASADGSRAIITAQGGSLDPLFPAAAAKTQLYDVSAGEPPALASLLPGELPPTCSTYPPGAGVGDALVPHGTLLSADGDQLYFVNQGAGPCDDPATGTFEGPIPSIYLRDLAAGATAAVPTAPLAGPACAPDLLRALDTALFFTTTSKLAADDTEPASCGAPTRDVYRYQPSGGSLECLTCVGPELTSGFVNATTPARIAGDGSRLYFLSSKRLVAGASGGLYRADSAGELAFVAPYSGGLHNVSLTADGARIGFSSLDSALDPLGPAAPTNDGTPQIYRYDDLDRSLTCISCPADGSAPLGAAGSGGQPSDDGSVFAFSTPTALLGADTNTNPGQPFRGTDVYEWRDGRLLLVTDGATAWPSLISAPSASTVGASGRDLIFEAPAILTADAIDDLPRVYDARIGGGMDFPPPGLPPCDLNSGACEGPASTEPDPAGAGSAAFEGEGDRRDPFPRECSAASRRAGQLSRAARKLRRAAGRAANPKHARALRRKAKRLSVAAKRQRAKAKRCRKANRNRGAVR